MTDPDAIARRAYELYLSRGSEPGHEMEDWLQAEAELKAQAPADTEADEGHRSLEGVSDESDPATGQERPAPRKRSGGSRRVTRQPDTD
jgi:hypothetical protein